MRANPSERLTAARLLSSDLLRDCAHRPEEQQRRLLSLATMTMEQRARAAAAGVASAAPSAAGAAETGGLPEGTVPAESTLQLGSNLQIEPTLVFDGGTALPSGGSTLIAAACCDGGGKMARPDGGDRGTIVLDSATRDVATHCTMVHADGGDGATILLSGATHQEPSVLSGGDGGSLAISSEAPEPAPSAPAPPTSPVPAPPLMLPPMPPPLPPVPSQAPPAPTSMPTPMPAPLPANDVATKITPMAAVRLHMWQAAERVAAAGRRDVMSPANASASKPNPYGEASPVTFSYDTLRAGSGMSSKPSGVASPYGQASPVVTSYDTLKAGSSAARAVGPKASAAGKLSPYGHATPVDVSYETLRTPVSSCSSAHLSPAAPSSHPSTSPPAMPRPRSAVDPFGDARPVDVSYLTEKLPNSLRLPEASAAERSWRRPAEPPLLAGAQERELPGPRAGGAALAHNDLRHKIENRPRRRMQRDAAGGETPGALWR